jgi:CheY-like chemotaxis protein
MPAEARPQPLVLVIDDDAWIRSIMVELLESDGFSVLQASDRDSGLNQAQEMRPDVILLDLALPGRAGLEVLTVLKDREPTREIPVIIIRAYALLLLRGGLQRAGGLLQKPLDLADLLASVRDVARTSSSTQSHALLP